MSDKNKNKRVSPGEFFRYLRKELKGSGEKFPGKGTSERSLCRRSYGRI